MAIPSGFWGIDIGQCGLKALRLEMIDGAPTATAFDYVEHPKILSQPDAEPDILTRQALETFLSRNSLKGDQVAISVAGQSGLARFVKLPPVEEKKVGDIVKFEAKQQIPFPLEEVVWDYQKIAGGEVAGGFAMETEIGLFAMKRDMISRYMSHFTGVGVECHLVQMAPLALCNYATYEILKKGIPGKEDQPIVAEDAPKGKKLCVVVLDIGTDSSNLIITDGGKIIWQRPVPLGGNNFTRALTKEMKLTFAKAEHLKRNAAKSPDLPAILKALRPVLTDFVGEVQRSLGYFTSTHRDAHVAYMVGLGNAFKLPGLQKYLAEKLSLDVRKPAKIEELSGDQVLNDPVLLENVLSFPVAYGLALQGIDKARLKTNLLPPEIRTDRIIRAKKPWAAAAAAALLLGTGALATGYGVQLGKTADAQLKKAREEAKSAASLADAQEAAVAAKNNELNQAKEDVKVIVKGQDERLNWIRLHEVISVALPRHGDKGNLEEQFQQTFWRTGPTKGDRAFEKFSERLRDGVPADRAWEDDMSQYLAQVNVEAVSTRYVYDLKKFLEDSDTHAKQQYGESIFDQYSSANDCELDSETKKYKPKAPEGGGWVVEVRGWTYHDDGENFVKNAVRRNFIRAEKFINETGAPRVQGAKNKVAQYIPGMEDPLKGKMSHPFVLLVKRVKDPVPNTFSYLQNSEVDKVVGGSGMGGLPGGPPGAGEGIPGGPGRGGAGSAPPSGMPGGPGAPGAVASNWTPISSFTLPAASGGGFGGPGEGAVPGGPGGPPPGSGPVAPPSGSPGGGGGRSGPPGIGGFGAPGPVGSSDSGIPGTQLPGGAPGAAPPGAGVPSATPVKKEKPRIEFVLCFIWREPTPTDPTPAAPEAAAVVNPGG